MGRPVGIRLGVGDARVKVYLGSNLSAKIKSHKKNKIKCISAFGLDLDGQSMHFKGTNVR